jgi:hypothetical protein
VTSRGSKKAETRAGIPVLRWLAEPYLLSFIN